jgi:hypothetical protein
MKMNKGQEIRTKWRVAVRRREAGIHLLAERSLWLRFYKVQLACFRRPDRPFVTSRSVSKSAPSATQWASSEPTLDT